MSESRELAGMAGLMRSIVTCIAGSLILAGPRTWPPLGPWSGMTRFELVA